MHKTLIASVLTLFLAAGFAPAVLGDETQSDGSAPPATPAGKENREYKEARKELKEDRKEIKEDRKELKEDKKEYREDRQDFREKYGRPLPGNVSLDLSGTAVGKDNATYTFDLTAAGKGLLRLKERAGNETGARFAARLLAHVVVKDDNGTVVKERDLRVHLYARTHGNETKWMLVSVADRENGMPKLVLKGEATKVSAGVFDLTGKGRALFHVGDVRVPLKIVEVSGQATYTPPTVAYHGPGPSFPRPTAASPRATAANVRQDEEPTAASG